MPDLIVVNHPRDWPLHVDGPEILTARSYLGDPRYGEMRSVRLYNLCRSYRYQSSGYYVSLLAAARGHRPLPSIATILDLKYQASMRFVSADLDALIQRSLAPIQSSNFVLSIYFGHNLARRHDGLANYLFKLFQAPLLRARFVRGDRWILQNIRAIAGTEIPDEHRPFALEMARQFFAGRRPPGPRRSAYRYDIAILRNPREALPPSDERALRRFERAARDTGLYPELIDKDDFGRLGEYDALFIRETTAVNHHTYRFARRAEAEGLVVVDDPLSILRCTNKVFLAELLERHSIRAPRTVVLGRGGCAEASERLDFPCVLKQPDSSFSQGVVKVENRRALDEAASRLFESSDLLIAQEYIPTEYDWRVGVFNRVALYVCRYYMARGHWQIMKHSGTGEVKEGKATTIAVDAAPPALVRAALRAAGLVGDGLYGVDLKEWRGKYYVIEINDNPSIDAGVEDAVLKDELYRTIMREFLRRIEQRKSKGRRA